MFSLTIPFIGCEIYILDVDIHKKKYSAFFHTLKQIFFPQTYNLYICCTYIYVYVCVTIFLIVFHLWIRKNNRKFSSLYILCSFPFFSYYFLFFFYVTQPLIIIIRFNHAHNFSFWNVRVILLMMMMMMIFQYTFFFQAIFITPSEKKKKLIYRKIGKILSTWKKKKKKWNACALLRYLCLKFIYINIFTLHFLLLLLFVIFINIINWKIQI